MPMVNSDSEYNRLEWLCRYLLDENPRYRQMPVPDSLQERRDLFRRIDCFVCNRQEAGLLFAEDLTGLDPESMAGRLAELLRSAQIPSMVVTLGEAGAVWANQDGLFGVCPALPMPVTDTTGAGDAFFSGVAAGLTYGKSLAEACSIGTRLASAVICSLDNTCPHFEPEEFGLIRSS